GCPKGTVLSRLARARERLRRRLTSRGLTLSAGLFAAVLASGTALAQVPAPLAETTVRAGLAFATGQAAAGVVAPPVLHVTEGVLRAMVRRKVQILVTSLVALALVGALAALVVHRAVAGYGGADDPKAIEGTWKGVAVDREGQPPPDDDYVKRLRIVFAG